MSPFQQIFFWRCYFVFGISGKSQGKAHPGTESDSADMAKSMAGYRSISIRVFLDQMQVIELGAELGYCLTHALIFKNSS